ncbi:MAG: D-alanyl-D-alanine carboxypeptidase family protein [Patescibacteria group bacterium]|nr:D-alanyl-D-alanine carboxypeptidase family protein [Patescibacteria group bacterium]
MSKNLKIIPDSKLVKIPIKDNGEPLVYINDFVPKVVIKIPKYIKDEGEKFIKQSSKVRISVAKMLKIAQELLPDQYRLRIRSGYRSLMIQKKAYQRTFNKMRKNNPNWSLDKLKDEVSKFVAPLDIVPPHSTGGAVDISIIGPNDKQLDMGTRIGQDTRLEKTRTDSNKISSMAIKNRKLLVKIMSTAGFINYPTE